MYVLFEGFDRAGKSSTIDFLKNKFKPSVVLHSDTLLGISLPSLRDKVSPEVLYMLFWQAIRETDLKVEECLNNRVNVLVDRGFMSNIAYSFHIDSSFKTTMDDIYLHKCIKPDLILYFSVSYNAFLHRAKEERVDLSFYSNVVDGYNHLISKLKGLGYTIYEIDGDKLLSQVYEDAFLAIEKYRRTL